MIAINQQPELVTKTALENQATEIKIRVESHKASILALSEKYIDLGFRVIPLDQGVSVLDGAPLGKGHGKKPVGKLVPHGCKDATNDINLIGFWIQNTSLPLLNLAIVTGHDSGIFMIGPDGPSGIAAIEYLEKLNGDLPVTLKAKSGGGGHHYVFRYPADGRIIKNAQNHRKVPIDIRGEGGYFAVAPSLHATSGIAYEWLTSLDTPIAEAPEWLLDWCAKPIKESAKITSDNQSGANQPSNSAKFADVIIDRAAKYVATIGPAIKGKGRSKVTSRVACALVIGFDLSVSEAMPIIRQWANANTSPLVDESYLRRKLEWAQGQPGTKGELRNTGKSNVWDDAEFACDKQTIDEIIAVIFAPTSPALQKFAEIFSPDLNANEPATRIEIMPFDWTARDFQPEPHALPPASTSSSSVCPHRKIIHQERGSWCREILADCKQWTCHVCGPRKKQQYKDTATKHISAYGGEMFKFECAPKDWPSVSRQMQQRCKSYPLPPNAKIATDNKTATWIDSNGQSHTAELTRGHTVYALWDGTRVRKGTPDSDPETVFRIKGEVTHYGISYAAIIEPGGSILVFATEQPSSKKIQPVAIENVEATQQLSRKIDLADCPLKGKRLILTSHDWPLITDRDPGKPTGWKTITNAVRLCTASIVFEILEHHCIAYEKTSVRYRYFGVTFLTWKPESQDAKDRAMCDFANGFAGAHELDTDALFETAAENTENETGCFYSTA